MAADKIGIAVDSADVDAGELGAPHLDGIPLPISRSPNKDHSSAFRYIARSHPVLDGERKIAW
jgi:hypothetical protein